MFRFQIYSLSVILLIGGAASFVGETQALLQDREQLIDAQLVAVRAAAELALDQWALDNVNRTIELANGDMIRIPLTDLRQANPQDQRKLIDEAVANLLPALNGWRENIDGAGRPEWILVVNAEGRVLLRSNAPQDRSDSVAGIPLVSTMLGGAALDGVWVLEDGEYAVAAAASLGNGQVVGGVIAGFKLGPARITAIASKMPRLEGGIESGIALLWNGRPLGQSFVLDQAATIPASSEPTVYGANPSPYAPLPLLAPDLGQFVGTATSTRGWPSQLQLAVNVPHGLLFSDVAQRQILILSATILLVLLSLAWGLSIRGVVSKPLAMMVEHLSGVQQGANVGVLPEIILKDPYTRLGKLINMLITRVPVTQRTAASRDDLSNVLGSAPEAAPMATGDFQFAGIAGLSNPSSSGAEAAEDEPVASLPLDAFQPLPDDGGQSGIASLFDDAEPMDGMASAPLSLPGQDASPRSTPPASSPSLRPVAPPATVASTGSEEDSAADFMASLSSGSFASPSRPSKPPTPVAAPRSTPPPPAAAPRSIPPTPAVAPPSAQPSEWNPERTVMVQVPEELLAASASSAAPPSYAAPAAEPYNPDATVVAAIPDDLLQAAIRGPSVDPDEAHFKEVYEQFIATRKECGEAISDLSYDRFLVKLHKNREQLISKYGCRTVRFQVYVKAGKAALKAVPVRD
ncbi:MAG: MXAN_5187 C-terminal domain-containing protein [Pseudomonadota bacterium]